jgi:peptidyl-tRNA hydrolase, PTH1 family
MWLVVGLGNPGREYEHTRHNIGFRVVEEVARRRGAPSWKEKFGGETTNQGEVVFLRPQEYMNVSGMAVQRAAAFYKVSPDNIVVVHDEIDLPFGRVKLKTGGGHGGHNGLRSISENIGPDYHRIRCGVGKPLVASERERVVGHVLGGFSKEEQRELPLILGEAADAVELVLDKGPLLAMNRVNAEKHEK